MSNFLKMKLLRKTCCGCSSVKTGAIVICYVSLIQAIVPILNILSNTVPEITKDKRISNEYKRDLTWLSVVTIVIVVHALYGIYNKKPGYMVPFLLFKLVFLFLLTMILGFAPAVSDEIEKNFDTKNSEDVLPCLIVATLLAIAIEAYFLLVLFSHYQSLRQSAYETANAPAVGFTTAAEPDNLASFPPYNNEMPKKQAPPPYAV